MNSKALSIPAKRCFGTMGTETTRFAVLSTMFEKSLEQPLISGSHRCKARSGGLHLHPHSQMYKIQMMNRGSERVVSQPSFKSTLGSLTNLGCDVEKTLSGK